MRREEEASNQAKHKQSAEHTKKELVYIYKMENGSEQTRPRGERLSV